MSAKPRLHRGAGEGEADIQQAAHQPHPANHGDGAGPEEATMKKDRDASGQNQPDQPAISIVCILQHRDGTNQDKQKK
jgi:hypothetical protein